MPFGTGNPGYRVPDALGFVPKFGAVTRFAAATGLSRVTVLAMLRTGRAYVGADGEIYSGALQPAEGSAP